VATEHFISIALPYSTRESDDFHVSVFVTPKLEGDAATEASPDGTTLEDFDRFPKWTALVEGGLAVQLRDQAGVIACAPILGPLQPKLWKPLFPPTTPVRANVVPPLHERRWRSFDARKVHDIGKAIGVITAAASLVEPPAPGQHPLAPALYLTLRQLEVITGRALLGPIDDTRWTQSLDRMVGETGDHRGPRSPQEAGGPVMTQVLAALHEARRFYDRPEAKSEYKAEPDGPPPDRLKSKEPEFHERVAMLGDHSSLLRKLGLVIDLRVDQPDRLRSSRWISARHAVTGESGVRTGAAPRTRVDATADGALVTVPATSDWVAGALALGDTDRFAVLDIDPDGTALKTEQYLRVLARLLERQANREPVDAASPGLRAQGFTVVRTGEAAVLFDRLARQRQLETTFATPNPPGGGPMLASEDVARGVRVEVWDVDAGVWRSLHARHTTAEVVGVAQPVDLGDGFGFIQASPAQETPVANGTPPPLNVHEALFGWEGWSLSVAKPGKRVRDELVTHPDGTTTLEERVEEPPGTIPVGATNPVGFEHTIVPGTLPPLRYGHEYSFRAWLVDLAGNVRPPGSVAAGAGGIGQRVTPSAGGAKALATELGAQLAKEAPRIERAAGLGRLGPLGEELRSAAVEVIKEPVALIPERPAPTLSRGAAAALRRELQGVIGTAETRAVVADAAGAAPSRAAIVTSAAREALVSAPVTAFGQTARSGEAEFASAAAGHLGRSQVSITPGRITPGVVLEVLRTITVPRPFLRWEPVPPPTLVPQGRYSEGESQRVLVIRSGVVQDPVTLEVTVTDPATYQAEVLAADPDTAFRAVAARHLVPPKIGQLQAELHGAFDPLVGGGSPAELRSALAAALRENGNLYDIDVADLANPGVRIPVADVAIAADPGIPPGEVVTLPVDPEEPLPEGQYVVHTGDTLEVPYLPDPLARGIAVVFPDARVVPTLVLPFGIEGFTTDYAVPQGGWPRIEPLRLDLTVGPTPRVTVDGPIVEFAVPAGTAHRFRLSSALSRDPDALDALGLWRTWPAVITNLAAIREAAYDGYIWGLTPKEDVRLVHAVPRPVQAPRPVHVGPFRPADATYSSLLGGVHLHGPSTEQLTLEATWTDFVDDPALPRHEERAAKGIGFVTPVVEAQRLAILFPADFLPNGDLDWTPDPTIRLHANRHEWGDTKHRRVAYRVRASTRFREYFPPALLTGDPDVELDDGSSVVSEVVEVSVPSSARPAPPVVHSVVPLFRWSHDDPYGDDPPADDEGSVHAGQPIAERHTRRAGVRIYLDRPWFSSGEGELLGVLVGFSQATGPYSLFAADPIWVGHEPDNPRILPLTGQDLWQLTGHDDVRRPGDPVARAVNLRLPTGAGEETTYVATVLGYQPQYNEERRLWYVDVALNPGKVVWPFLRLTVARYQPESITGAELSSPVVTDFVQLPPERTTYVSRLDDHAVRVVVTGAISHRPEPPTAEGQPDLLAIAINRVLVARLQQKDPELAGDLGWITVDSRPLLFGSYDPVEHLIAWGTTLGADEAIPLQRPGPELSDWRVTVEEWERFPGDSDPLAPPLLRQFPVWEQRLVFADEIYL
jgi:hypothetical protein